MDAATGGGPEPGASRAAVTVVGIGEDGWDGLGEAARAALRGAPLIVGSPRQLALLPELGVRCAPLPSPLLENLDALVADHPGLCLLASGDPMRHGIGVTLARRLAPGALRVLPAVSSVALACARLGWPEPGTEVISLVTQRPEAALAGLAPGARLILLARDGGTPATVAARLTAAGWGDSELTILERLGGPAERIIGPLPARGLAASAVPETHVPGGVAGTGESAGAASAGIAGVRTDRSAGADTGGIAGADTDRSASAGADRTASAGAGRTADASTAEPTGTAPRRFADLCVVAIRAVAGEAAAGGRALGSGRLPGLPDDAYETDGQITRRELRVLALAALRPEPGELLWDVGAGSGSIGIEWLRAEPLARAIAVEARPDRAERALQNADALGVPHLQMACGHAPGVLAGLSAPDAVFIGGGVTTPFLLEACWARLRPGGRLVAHAVTVESGAVLHAWQRAHGGQLTQSAISYLDPLGSFTTWRPALPVIQWSVTRGPDPADESADGSLPDGPHPGGPTPPRPEPGSQGGPS
jgi:precorrin-6Y C5,15-methyltransferase (decarboxylating)